MEGKECCATQSRISGENIRGLLFDNSNSRLITFNTKRLHFWNLQNATIENQLFIPEEIISVALNPINNKIAVGTTCGNIWLHNLSDYQLEEKFSADSVSDK